MTDESARRPDPRRETALDRYWDAVVDGRLAAPDPALAPNDRLAVTVRRVHALAGQPLPDPDRAEQLWRELMSSYRPTAPLRLNPALPRPTNGHHGAVRPSPGSQAPPRGRTRMRTTNALNWVATVALIAVVLTMIFFIYRNGQNVAVPPVQETPTAAPSPHGWLQFRGDAARTGNVPGPGPAGQPVLLWSTEPQGVTGNVGISDPPVIADGVMYLSTSGGLLAIDTQTGAEIWRVQGYGGGSAIDGDGLIVRSEGGGTTGLRLARLSRSDGHVVWTSETGLQQVIWYPTIADGVLYIPSEPNDLLAMDPATGDMKWRVTLSAPALRSVAVTAGIAVVVTTDGKVSGVETTSGDVVWTYEVPPGGTIGTPALADGVAYVGIRDQVSNTFYAIAGSDASATPDQTATANSASSSTPVSTATASFVWAASGDSTDTLSTAGVVRVSPDGKLWVAGMSSRFFIFDLDGNLLEIWGEPGSGPGQFAFSGGGDEWAGMAFAHDGAFYVIDPLNRRVHHFDRNRQLLETWGTKGREDGQFLMPTGVAFDPNGEVLVTDRYRGVVQRFSATGTFISSFDGTGGGGGAFVGPTGIAVSSNGDIYVIDQFANVIRVFDRQGVQIGTVGAEGPNHGGFNQPGDLELGEDGFIYVADQGNNVAKVFDNAGNFVFSWGGYGSGDGQFNFAASVALNKGGTVYVADAYGNRIEKFKITGPFPAPAAGTPTT